MDCNCGSQTREKQHTKTVKTVVVARITYECCIICGRSGRFMLYVDGKPVAMGKDAIKQFDRLAVKH